ncbi:MAG: hypothetical protein JO025_07615 [Verrucomicrobia bacterium]|nr:hypothetical protein [Verrucomicrobiota bacterium]
MNAADHCDGQLWIAPGRPHSAETLSAICGRDVIWMREALELLFRTGLLSWRGEELRVMAITHWESEQEPLPTVNRRKALSASAAAVIGLVTQNFTRELCANPPTTSVNSRSICYGTSGSRNLSLADDRWLTGEAF